MDKETTDRPRKKYKKWETKKPKKPGRLPLLTLHSWLAV
jgi:hypothetical protein